MLVGGQEASIDVTHTVHSPERLLIGIFDPVNLTNDWERDTERIEF